MNWIFEAYSNLYNTAMGQRTFHHETRGGSLDQRRHIQRTGSKTTRNFF